MKSSLYKISLLSILFWIASCDQNFPNNELIATENSRLVIKLTDAPGDFEEVNIDIQGLEVLTVEQGKINLENFNAGIYDLLTLQNGIEEILFDEDFPSGKITQIRLILGEENTVKIDGEIHPLTTPGAQNSGLKLKMNASSEDGSELSILLDFDAAKSVHQAGNSGKFILKPVIIAILSDGTEFENGDDGDDDGDDDDDDDGDDDDGDDDDDDDDDGNN